METVSPQTVNQKRSVWSYVGVFGAFLMFSPLFGALFTSIIITPLFKTDGDLPIGIFLLLLIKAVPVGVILVIIGLIGLFLTKNKSAVNS